MRLLLIIVTVVASGIAQAADKIDVELQGALAATSRPGAGRERDENRAPRETLTLRFRQP